MPWLFSRKYIFLLFLLLVVPAEAQNLFTSSDRTNSKSRVVIVHDPEAMVAFQAVPDQMGNLIHRAITNLTGKPTPRTAWSSLISTQDVVGIKVFSLPGPNSGTRPAVVAAVVQDLLDAGLPATNIIVWDKRAVDLRLAGYFEFEKRFGIRVAGSTEAGYDEKTFYETPLLGTLSWTDLEFGSKGPGIGRKSYVSKLVSQQMTKIINITPLMHHNQAGVSGNLYSLAMGSVDNVLRFETDHDNLARAVPEIYALAILGDRVVLNIVDALICQYNGEEKALLHYSTMLNELRVSKDPVALDVLSVKEIDRQRQLSGVPAGKTDLELYVNAALLQLGVEDPKKINVENVR